MRHLLFFAALSAAAQASPALADDDDRNNRRAGVSQERAIQIARGYGMVRVTKVERDDGGWEVEGRDHRGRELEVTINSRGRVTEVDRHDDDEDDD